MDNCCWNIVFGFHGLYFSWSGTKCSTKKNNFKKKELCLTLMLIARHGGQFTTSDNIRRRDECWNPGGAPGPDRFWHFDKPTLETTSCYKQVGDWKSLWMSTIGLCTEQRLQFVCRKNSAASPKAGPPTSVQANVKSKSQPFQPLSYRVSTFHFRSSHSHRFPFKQVAHPLQKCFFCIVPYPRRGRTRQTQDGKFRISKGKFNMHLMNLMYTNVCWMFAFIFLLGIFRAILFVCSSGSEAQQRSFGWFWCLFR